MARNKGFSIVEVLIVVLVLALVGFIGWKVWDMNTNQPSNAPTTTEEQSSDTDVKNTEDLDKVDKTLDNTNIEGNEADQLDAEVSF